MLEGSCGRITPQTRYAVRLPNLLFGTRRNQEVALNPSGNKLERRTEWSRLRYDIGIPRIDWAL